MHLNPAELEALLEQEAGIERVVRGEPLWRPTVYCIPCSRETYPTAWCNCDPKLQMMRYVDPEAIITMQEPQDELSL